jgi:hypothetical protein
MAKLISDKGSPNCDVWVIVNRPLSNDDNRGYVYSGGLGYLFDKMMQDAGIFSYFVTCYYPDLDNPTLKKDLISRLNTYHPRIIIPLDSAGQELCPELVPSRRDKNYDPEENSEIFKYAGSLLKSEKLNYDHFVLNTLPPDLIARQYRIRDQVVSCDLAKAASELAYFKKHGNMQPLPQRKLQIDFESFDELLHIIDSMKNATIVSNDIETVYPRAGSEFKGVHPGYPITIGLAPSRDFGVSFDLFRESTKETVELWKHMNEMFKAVPQLGQNFFNFDLNFYEMLGFEIDPMTAQDTMIRHHVLWAELPHKLQFLCRQYCREPFYKEDGKGWSIKDMRGLKRYNALDCCVTMEVFEEQEKEFIERPWLR